MRSCNRFLSSLLPSVMVLLGLALGGCSVESTPKQSVAPLLNQPVVDVRLSQDDFGFPSEPPSLKRGKDVFQANCVACHAPSFWLKTKTVNDLAYTTPIDLYLMLTNGKAPEVTNPSNERREVLPTTHPAFREKLNRDDRWAAIFYARHLAGGANLAYNSLEGKPLDVASIYGGNCAVCHGKRGFADGPLHSGHASSHELASAKLTTGLFQPPPANFHEYKRLYNRTDAQMFKYIVEGIYPSGMPPWFGKKDADYKFVFDDKLIWMLVRHERTFAYKNDLLDTDVLPVGPLPQRYAPVGMTGVKGSNYEEVHTHLKTPVTGVTAHGM
jgi:mono/diheme cytochrome c family protein